MSPPASQAQPALTQEVAVVPAAETAPLDIRNRLDDLQLGWDSCGGYLTGDLDDVAIYASALSAAEVSKIYDDGINGKAQCRDPVTKADCKNGGWADFGFKNQGQCIRFVNTGKDGR